MIIKPRRELILPPSRYCELTHDALMGGGLPVAQVYTYWRIYVTANAGNTYTGFGEIEFIQSGTSANRIGLLVKDVLSETSWGAEYAVDGNPTTACLSAANSMPWWYGFIYDGNANVIGVNFYGGVSSRWPAAYVLQKSTDGITWVNA